MKICACANCFKDNEILKYENFVLSHGNVSLVVGEVTGNDLLFSSYFIVSFRFSWATSTSPKLVPLPKVAGMTIGKAEVQCGLSRHTALTCVASVDCGLSRHRPFTCVASVVCGLSRHRPFTCVASVYCGLSRHRPFTCVASVDCGLNRYTALTCVASVDCGLSRHTALTCVASVVCGLSRHTTITCVVSVDCGLRRHTELPWLSSVDLSHWPILASEQIWCRHEIPPYDIHCIGKSFYAWVNCPQRDMWVFGGCNVRFVMKRIGFVDNYIMLNECRKMWKPCTACWINE
jgi:hypothetical protein